jgi:hypothetical protein
VIFFEIDRLMAKQTFGANKKTFRAKQKESVF